MALLLETTLGDLVMDLDIEGSPEACRNVLRLAHLRFYSQTLLHRILPNRFVACGDPVGDGTGGTSVYGLLDDDQDCHKDNGSSNNVLSYTHSRRRFLSQARAGRTLTVAEAREPGRVVAACQQGVADTIGSQFWITLGHGVEGCGLDGYYDGSGDGNAAVSDDTNTNYVSLGMVTEDFDKVLDRLNAAFLDGEGRPYADVRIQRVLVLDDPFETVEADNADAISLRSSMLDYMKRNGLTVVQERQRLRVVDSPSPPLRPLCETVPRRIQVTEVKTDDMDNLDGNDSDDSRLVAERARRRVAEEEEASKRETASRAVVLEMLGDLPSAEVKAPEDVLFLCKLNPVTTDEDLELIMSRFDEKVSVEIIRDSATGASLQYAFAEFTTSQAATECYFKLNNALVDDRRIKVDFSQSVAKLWDKYNQKLKMPTSLSDNVQRGRSNNMGGGRGGRGIGGRGWDGHGVKSARYDRHDRNDARNEQTDRHDSSRRDNDRNSGRPHSRDREFQHHRSFPREEVSHRRDQKDEFGRSTRHSTEHDHRATNRRDNTRDSSVERRRDRDHSLEKDDRRGRSSKKDRHDRKHERRRRRDSDESSRSSSRRHRRKSKKRKKEKHRERSNDDDDRRSRKRRRDRDHEGGKPSSRDREDDVRTIRTDKKHHDKSHRKH